MWKLFNKIFGWDYVAWKDSCHYGIAKLHRDGSGNVYYWKYSITSCLGDMNEITVWLTCKPEKYLKEGGARWKKQRH